jgi:iron-sulfur cluster repair protein YtfE (RIC family)
MDAIAFLIRQHREADVALRRSLETTGAERWRAIELLAECLSLHAEIEERLFYPACRRAGLDATIDEAHADHDRMTADLARLAAMEDELELDHALASLLTDLGEHLASEEQDVFPLLQARLGDQLDALGRRMEELSENLVSSDRDEAEAAEREEDQGLWI